MIDGQAGADVIDGGHGNDTSSGGAPARAMERPSCLTMMPMASKIPLIAHGNQGSRSGIDRRYKGNMCHAMRGKVGQYHREVKQTPGMEKCQCRSIRAQRNHIDWNRYWLGCVNCVL